MKKLEQDYCKDFAKNKQEQLDDIISDFKKGERALKNLYANISIFGSARFDENNPYYVDVLRLSKMLSDEGFNILSGGSGGVMEAANKGAYLSGKSESVGINIILPFEQTPNPYTTRLETLKNFNMRKTVLIKKSLAFIVFPGGYGTLDELFEVAALTQTKKIPPVKIFLVGKKFWQPLMDFIETSLVDYKTIDKKDADLFKICDNFDQIINEVKEHTFTYLEVLKNIGLENSADYKQIKKRFHK